MNKGYIEPDVLLRDERFKINSEFFTSLCDNSFILDYEVKNIKLKDIKRYRDKKIYKINEVHPYLYLEGKINASEYCRQQGSETIDRFENLIKSVKENSFDNLYIPILNSNGIILDGQHRSCILYHLYGGDYEIPCVTLKLKKKRTGNFLSKIFSIKSSSDKLHKTNYYFRLQNEF